MRSTAVTLLRRFTTLTAAATGSVALAFGVCAPAVAAPAPVPAAPSAATELAGKQQAAAPGDLLGAYQSTVEALRGFGMDPFLYPTAAAFCGNGSTFGLVPAVAGAMPGPWPKTTVSIPGLDLTAVKSGQTMFTFVPYGVSQDSRNTAGMQVAWLNVSNGRSGITKMGPLADIFRAMIPAEVPADLRPHAERAVQEFFFAALPVGGIRAVPVDTGKGTVLAAVFGTVENGNQSCFFLPTIGITSVP
ncbi:hypothetical protein [Nocardia amikacinitolerans]|uniref:hypothetical protein n=1 Tax=Nocardia amikacinitolerans TaxID=756689 RepID=UPI000BE33C87|nr:hypothetical protein [Nocardia amikacinitolerans]